MKVLYAYSQHSLSKSTDTKGPFKVTNYQPTPKKLLNFRMRLPGGIQAEDSKTTRKLLKPQVEKQRRERMNRSLEALRVLLLEDSQHQGKISRRIEKAEILEETVLFLKKSSGKGSKVGDQQQVQDGFSACLQRAARFLHGSGAALHVDATLQSKFFHWRMCAGAKAPVVARCPPVDSTELSAQTWQRRVAFRSSAPLHHRVALAYGDSNVPQRPQRDSPRSARSPPVSQVMWRPWP